MTSGVLLCDKPAGLSSHAVVSWVRKALETRAVGHAGTLDPMATGLLVLGVDEGLKILRYLTQDDKVYEATVRLGSETDTLDAEGREVRSAALPDTLSEQRVCEILRQFEGEIIQRAPAVSAIKQGGVALHKRVRRGERVEPPERKVLVQAIALGALRSTEIDLRIHCGKGFYVRSFARDLALALGTVGHLSALRRTQSGQFQVGQCVPGELLRAAAASAYRRAELRARMLPIVDALAHVPKLVLDDAGTAHARHGRPVPFLHVVEGNRPDDQAEVEPLLLCNRSGAPVALARCTAGSLFVVRGFPV